MRGAAAFVEHALQLVDGGQIVEQTFVPVLKIKELQMRDAAVAVVEQFEHVAHVESGEVQNEAVAGVQGGELLHHLRGRAREHHGHVLLIRADFGQIRTLKPVSGNDRAREILQFQNLAFGGAVVVLTGNHAFLELLGPNLRKGQHVTVHALGQMLERRLTEAHAGHEGVRP